MRIGVAGTGEMGAAIEAKSRGIELPLVERTLACYEETKRDHSGTAEISTVSVYWANRAQR
jgi:hypothetical protein